MGSIAVLFVLFSKWRANSGSPTQVVPLVELRLVNGDYDEFETKEGRVGKMLASVLLVNQITYTSEGLIQECRDHVKTIGRMRIAL